MVINFSNLMKRKCILIVAAALFLAGCSLPQKVTEDVRANMTSECIPLAKEWFETNLPEAKVESMELYSTGYDCTRSVRGVYSQEGTEHGFWYNCDTNEMLSDANMGYAMEYTAKLIGDELGLDGYVSSKVYNLEFIYNVTYVENRKNGWSSDEKARIEIEQNQVGSCLPYLPINADTNEIEQMVLDRIKIDYPTQSVKVIFIYENNPADLDEGAVNEIYEKYPGFSEIKVSSD